MNCLTLTKLPKLPVLDNFEDLWTGVAEGMEGFIQDVNNTLRDIMTFYGQSDLGMGFDVTKMSEVNVSVKYMDICQVAKDIVKPLNVCMNQLSTMSDMQNSLLRAIIATYGRENPYSFNDFFPALF